MIEPFTIHVEDAVLDDLRARIRATRWPDPAPGAPWERGTDLAYLRDLLAYWADGFDWRARERELNAYAHFRAELDGVRIHFVHERARSGDGIPLILRDYYDNRWFGGPPGLGEVVRVPTGIAAFTTHHVDEGEPPREWSERLYDIVRYTPMPRGGHFAPREEPELLARDIAAFFGGR